MSDTAQLLWRKEKCFPLLGTCLQLLGLPEDVQPLHRLCHSANLIEDYLITHRSFAAVAVQCYVQPVSVRRHSSEIRFITEFSEILVVSQWKQFCNYHTNASSTLISTSHTNRLYIPNLNKNVPSQRIFHFQFSLSQ